MAAVARPPSPLKPAVPLPAMVLIMLTAGAHLGSNPSTATRARRHARLFWAFWGQGELGKDGRAKHQGSKNQHVFMGNLHTRENKVAPSAKAGTNRLPVLRDSQAAVGDRPMP